MRDYYKEVCKWLGKSYPTIDQARDRSKTQINNLPSHLVGLTFAESTGFLVFGSLARSEFTEGSDLDWTLLVDGPSELDHYQTSLEVRKRLVKEDLIEPGTSGLFGGITSGHELLHNIGGLEDTNANMTRRLLLLLESVAIEGSTTRNKVIAKLLERYVRYGSSVETFSADGLKPPRFLLNDFVRFWRTMAVDYAAKKWLQADKKWALRNAKLRFSRKLIFMKGLLLCLDCELFPKEWPWKDLNAADYEGMPESRLQEGLKRLIDLPALDTLCRSAILLGAKEPVAAALRSYDLFLSTLNDASQREHLKGVPFEDAEMDETFSQLRVAGKEFGQALETLLFDSHPKMTALAKEYGVF
ncbi:hypothetical protein Mal64_15460 [Pseudobythopirellula maris]|uniref:Polymerase nucleotidyl transferase domain-containing protein n=1 Tax=Pseudobythopirellula maris TaxID=2527991 RepID=A0A5C5ZVV5_9BACT|nr:nucleotidyltransferase domain-containing protein [Pseudobythopirellula maris]TWT91147.1 hypothetical protein Mal64_15460 [Pseudobythopirellula maris]